MNRRQNGSTMLSCGICWMLCWFVSSFFFSQADNSFTIINGSHITAYYDIIWLREMIQILNNYRQTPIPLTQRLSLFSSILLRYAFLSCLFGFGFFFLFAKTFFLSFTVTGFLVFLLRLNFNLIVFFVFVFYKQTSIIEI